MMCKLNEVGVVVIGRNEAAGLRECLLSIPKGMARVVYVDSGSTDGSIGIARECEVEVVELGAHERWSAAKARQAGFERLMAMTPALELVQFVDGDCVLDGGWLGAAAMSLTEDAGAVSGRRREVRPGASVYNRICEIEWAQGQASAGACEHFGGDVLMRVKAYREAGGYDAEMVACEDHDLSARLRERGWRIESLDIPMTWHDSRMTRASQWFWRCHRRGVGYAQMWERHRRGRQARAMVRALVWGCVVPGVAVALAPWTRGLSLIVLVVAYGLRAVRIAGRAVWEGRAARGDALAWGVHCVAASFVYCVGIGAHAARRCAGRKATLIEYHRPAAGVARSAREPEMDPAAASMTR
jgi:hypothetical protein